MLLPRTQIPIPCNTKTAPGRQTLTAQQLHLFQQFLAENEKSPATISKYVRILLELQAWLGERTLSRQTLTDYREALRLRHQAQTVNGKLCAINAYLTFANLTEMRARLLKIQRRSFLPEKREMSESDYKQLLKTAQKRNDRLYHLMLTLGGTGIRVSELRFLTMEAVMQGRVEISMKGKTRTVLLPKELCQRLKAYAKRNDIAEGCIFRTRSGKPLDRSNICHALKKLCDAAHVAKSKVYPHSFRHLFARCFYAVEKNLVHLADVLGHSSIDTTRLYVMASANVYQHTLNRMHLLI